MPGNPNELLEVSQVARSLQVSRQTVYNLIHAGKLRAAKFGVVHGFKIKRGEMERFRKSNEGCEFFEFSPGVTHELCHICPHCGFRFPES